MFRHTLTWRDVGLRERLTVVPSHDGSTDTVDLMRVLSNAVLTTASDGPTIQIGTTPTMGATYPDLSDAWVITAEDERSRSERSFSRGRSNLQNAVVYPCPVGSRRNSGRCELFPCNLRVDCSRSRSPCPCCTLLWSFHPTTRLRNHCQRYSSDNSAMVRLHQHNHLGETDPAMVRRSRSA